LENLEVLEILDLEGLEDLEEAFGVIGTETIGTLVEATLTDEVGSAGHPF
jgi:hypothetical protein